ncbi:MAG: 30S ribosomal protein S24e [Thermoplasmatales archaeon]|nr:30S ribosomal protein S24e [Thermoplasmatales archaeon]
MKVEVSEQKDNLLLKRKEIRFTVDHRGGATPAKAAVVEELKKAVKGKGVVVIESMESKYGIGVSEGYAKMYDTLEAAWEVEKEHIMARNGYTKPEYVPPAPEAEAAPGAE